MTVAARIRVEVSEGTAAWKAAHLAIEHHLYVNPSWQLFGRLLSVKTGSRQAVVALAYKDDEPHAVVLLRVGQDSDVAAYTKQKSRREGLGSACIKAIRDAGYTFPTAGTGIEGSHHFWRNNNLHCPEDWGCKER